MWIENTYTFNFSFQLHSYPNKINNISLNMKMPGIKKN
jgi:hypothetical protein